MFDAIVLSGGSAARLGGTDKPGLRVGGLSLLDRVLAAVADAARIVVVGPARTVTRPVLWCREDPQGGGPVAALAAGVPHVRADAVLTLAADLPSIGPAVPALLAALASRRSDCAALIDGDGRPNYLAAAWHRAALVGALSSVGQTAGASMRNLVSSATMIDVPDCGGWGLDCDTWSDLAAARSRFAPAQHAKLAVARAAAGQSGTESGATRGAQSGQSGTESGATRGAQ
ncbi:MAG: molybdenum cofactor guanylyltransferase [Jatrophihabitantaceae bacterium]